MSVYLLVCLYICIYTICTKLLKKLQDRFARGYLQNDQHFPEMGFSSQKVLVIYKSSNNMIFPKRVFTIIVYGFSKVFFSIYEI